MVKWIDEAGIIYKPLIISFLMKVNFKKMFKKYILIFILLIGIPSLTFWSLFFTADLPFINYITNSMAGWLTVVYLAWIEIEKKIDRKIVSIVIGAISLMIASLIVYYSFNWISQETIHISLTETNLAEAGFSFIFGVCVGYSFKIIYSKRYKELNNER